MGSFGLDVDKWCKGSLAKADVCSRKIVLTMFRRVVLRTPVRTGRARGNWLCTLDSPAMPTLGLAAVNDTDKSGRATIATITEGVQAWQAVTGRSILLTNNLPYIEELEHGYSRQAPSGMVAVTVAEFGGIAEDAAANQQLGNFGGSVEGMGGAWDAGEAGE